MLISSHPQASVTIDGRKVPCRELRIDLEPYHDGELIFRKFQKSVMLYHHDNSYPHTRYRVNRWTKKFNVREVMKEVLKNIHYAYSELELTEIEALYNKL